MGANLRIEATFTATSATSLATDDDGAAFVSAVEFFDAAASHWAPATVQDGSWGAPCLPSGCRIRYAFALGKAATTLAGVDTAMMAGGLIVAPPSTWLLRPTPSAVGSGSRLRLRVTGASFASGMPRSASEPELFEAGTSDMDAATFATFGPALRETVESGAARVEVAIAPAGLAMAPSEIKVWVQRSVAGIARYYGHFAVPRTLVVIVPGTERATEGETLGDGGPSVLVRAAPGLTAARAADDWVMIHELLHVTLPSLDRQEDWLSEGIATYVEPIIRARAGVVSVERFWSELVAGLPQGLPQAGDEGLERTHTWGRTYWGGALFCLVADVRIRERTGGARSLDDALRAVVATGANVESHWSLDRFLDEGDRGATVPVLRELYREMGLAPGSPDLGALWKRLGVAVDRGGKVTFDDRAELATIRRALAHPELKD